MRDELGADEPKLPFIIFEHFYEGEKKYMVMLPVDANAIGIRCVTESEYKKLQELTKGE